MPVHSQHAFGRRYALKGALAAGAAGAAVTLAPALSASADDTARRFGIDGRPDPPLDTSHATAALVAQLEPLYQAKSNRDLDAIMSHFDRKVLTYVDATLDGYVAAWEVLKEFYAEIIPHWTAPALSYPTRIIGDADSGITEFTDTAGLFGHEMRIVAAVDFAGGKITREVDYSDGRHFGIAAVNKLRAAQPPLPAVFGENTIREKAAPELCKTVKAVASALRQGEAAALTKLFSTDALYEDLTLHTTMIGTEAIGRFLHQGIHLLPYGAGTTVRHIVGSDQGGGYEWKKPAGRPGHGIIALELGGNGLITRLTAMWDGSIADRAQLTTLLQTTIES